MPPSAVRRIPATCSRCGNTIPAGSRFTWGKEKRVFHAGSCPTGETAPTMDADRDWTKEEETMPEPEPIESAHGLGELLESAIRKSVESVASTSALEAIRSEVESLRSLVHATKPITVKIEALDLPDVELKNVHSSMPELLRLMARRKNVYLYGLPGSGKSTAARQAAEGLTLDYGYISLNPQTPDSRLLGYMDATGVYRATVFYTCYVNGGVFCIDELDNASASLLTTLNGMIENGHGAFPCGVVKRHKDFILIGTGNTTGRGGDVLFPERRVFDAAFMERFVYVEWVYDLALEESLTLAQNPKALPWLSWVRSARAYCAKERIKVFFSPRSSIVGAELLADKFYTPKLVAERVGFRGMAEDVRERILKACPLPTVSMAA